ncbi:L,D-transpeptidase family protein [Rubripirellula reticaptiva]|uniref:L,D-transpeptidase catalytic domain n=1 Tax=Rubripirellula reticaptiva TaxID=2528013 RepID=A0A5C6EIR5_9BACT|nr:L,D-transpeptidase family protein [Rubripirellula reticaptiva]TWU48345.1 L,D-transpeptidase catalytic domain [Rubripirellula reticaptiva]
MQTLKTAAIVVLLMTVIYGAYVSLTTPPEPLPLGVEDMLVMSDDGSLMIDSALPPSLGELEINAGSLGGFPEVTQPADTVAASLMSPEPAMGNASAYSVPDFANRSIELPTNGTPASSASFSMSDVEESANAAVASVGAVGADLGAAASDAISSSADSAREYPTTNRAFEVPDPNEAQSKFDPNFGTRFASNSDDASAPVAQVSAMNVSRDSDLLTQGASLGGNSNLGLVNAIQIADRQYSKDQLKDALATLSLFYSTPNLSGEERSELVQRLDWLAKEVIYSKRHLLESAHRVGQSETLMEIASRYEVPWQLLANINQIQDPVAVLPGTELKVVRGPFRAEVDLTNQELTLFLGDLYSGRFPIGVGNDPMPKPGTFTVQDKQESRTFYDAAGSPIPPGSPDNPYGAAWIDLGGQLCIHGSPDATRPTEKGCISLAGDFADDLYGIISQGSSVTIRK